MIKIFQGGRGGDTFKTPSPPMNNFCLYPPPILRCFWKDPLMTPTPHHPTSSTFHCYPLPIHHPSPPLNILIIHKGTVYCYLHYYLFKEMNGILISFSECYVSISHFKPFPFLRQQKISPQCGLNGVLRLLV